MRRRSRRSWILAVSSIFSLAAGWDKCTEMILIDAETNSFSVETLPFQSAVEEEQTGFFHSTSIPIHTYRIVPCR
jgi:hypothetical protein